MSRPLLLGFLVLALACGCRSATDAERVVLYCAHDREFVEAILHDFTRQTGIQVVTRFDTEANKSVGLYEDLLREAGQPRCDVHWNNEILNTIRLQQHGVYAPYDSPAAVPFPARCRAADRTWTAFAARARVVIVNTDKVPAADWPRTLDDLMLLRWRGQVALAKPLFGTTATQAACLFQAWGPERAMAFYRRLHANDVRIVAGNKQVARGVGRGQFPLGLTDTDDAMAEIADGKPVAVLPIACGTTPNEAAVLHIPNTIAVVKNCPHPRAAQRLVDYLLSPAVETALAQPPSCQLPLNPQVKLPPFPALDRLRQAPPLAVDFQAAAAAWPASQQFLVAEFGLR